jgi:hypothetical protein
VIRKGADVNLLEFPILKCWPREVIALREQAYRESLIRIKTNNPQRFTEKGVANDYHTCYLTRARITPAQDTWRQIKYFK